MLFICTWYWEICPAVRWRAKGRKAARIWGFKTV